MKKSALKPSIERDKPYKWDEFSDQPYPLKDRQFKKSLRLRALPAYTKMLLVSFAVFPIVLARYIFIRRFARGDFLHERVGLCVNLDKDPDLTEILVNELGVQHLSIRIPLWDVANISAYKAFAERFSDRKILFVILQDRQHIQDADLLRKHMALVFSELSPLSVDFQIGNAINRTKWAFFSVDEYLHFFSLVQKLRDAEFGDVRLYGGSVIDFELYALLRSLWHGVSIKYDGFASLLYVDRRGAPEGRQFGFDLVGKINFIWAALLCTGKSRQRLLITETNWPIKDTAPYAPALGDVWVDEESHARYLLRYYLLALANGKASCIYWHQLIAPGYGLIDNREGVVKRPAYFVFRYLLEVLASGPWQLIRVEESSQSVRLFLENESGQKLQILWSKKQAFRVGLGEASEARSMKGEFLGVFSEVEVSHDPVYLYEILP